MEDELSKIEEHDNKKQNIVTERIPFVSKNKFKKSDFEIIGLLGRGAYAKVVKAKLISTDTIYAVKILERNFFEKVKAIF